MVSCKQFLQCTLYTLSINTIYLSHSTKVTGGTVFRKQTIFKTTKKILHIYFWSSNFNLIDRYTYD